MVERLLFVMKYKFRKFLELLQDLIALKISLKLKLFTDFNVNLILSIGGAVN